MYMMSCTKQMTIYSTSRQKVMAAQVYCTLHQCSNASKSFISVCTTAVMDYLTAVVYCPTADIYCTRASVQVWIHAATQQQHSATYTNKKRHSKHHASKLCVHKGHTYCTEAAYLQAPVVYGNTWQFVTNAPGLCCVYHLVRISFPIALDAEHVTMLPNIKSIFCRFPPGKVVHKYRCASMR